MTGDKSTEQTHDVQSDNVPDSESGEKKEESKAISYDGTEAKIPMNNDSNSTYNDSLVTSPDTAGADSGARLYYTLLKGRDITFRVTCTRGGRKHRFTSQDAAKHFGAGLARCFGWKVQLKQADVEVLLVVSGNSVTVGVALTRQAKFKRNIAHFGPTTLRATIAYGMLRYIYFITSVVKKNAFPLWVTYMYVFLPLFSSRCADIQPGDIVLDPLCGGGTINIEASKCICMCVDVLCNTNLNVFFCQY